MTQFSMLDKQTIIVSAGGQEYTNVLTIEEQDQKNISSAPIFMCLGASFTTPPTAWVTATDQTSPKNYIRFVQHLVTATYAIGDYYLWVKIQSTPEVILRPVARIFVR